MTRRAALRPPVASCALRVLFSPFWSPLHAFFMGGLYASAVGASVPGGWLAFGGSALLDNAQVTSDHRPRHGGHRSGAHRSWRMGRRVACLLYTSPSPRD